MKELLKTLKKGFFPSLIALSALSVSLSAAFYSVSGLSKLFAGASTEVIIMAGSLEVAKLVIASLLYRYWGTLNKYLRTYLSIATVVLVLITSMGIYGFLSAAYQETYSKLTITENEKSFIQQKANFYEKDVIRFDKELERISANISTLSNARSQSIQVRDTSVAGGVRTTISTSEIRLAQNRIKSEEENRKDIQKTREIAADSLQKFQLQVLQLENNPEIAGELGPLQYLSGLTGVPMDKIINILLLVIIFVFDPLAISLVIAANFAFDKAFEKNLYGEYSDADTLYDDDSYTEDQVKTDINDIEVDAEVVAPKGPYSSRMDIIGQNGNDGDHYEEETINEDVRPVKIIQKGPTNHNVLFSDGTQKRVSKDDNIIRYL
ncbi:hypothetical protein N9J42_00455 [bacterium]|nr:hypothetical protein [bacterium]